MAEQEIAFVQPADVDLPTLWNDLESIRTRIGRALNELDRERKQLRTENTVLREKNDESTQNMGRLMYVVQLLVATGNRLIGHPRPTSWVSVVGIAEDFVAELGFTTTSAGQD